MSFAWLAHNAPLRDLLPVERRLVSGLRHCAVAYRSGKWPVAVLKEHLGCSAAAAHLQLVLEEVGSAWPDPFCVSPLCCRRLSHDEALLAEMMRHAGVEDRPAFDRASHELIGADARERLFLSLKLLGRALARTCAPGTGDPLPLV